MPSGSETVQCGTTDWLQTTFPPEKKVYFEFGYKKAEKALETWGMVGDLSTMGVVRPHAFVFSQ
jgi:hypothetical protein